MSNDRPMQPWGLGRMTQRLPEVLPPYETTSFDPATQLTRFYDAGGAVVDMGKGTNRSFVTVTVSRGGGGDGSGGAAQVADDSENDSASD
ncbi:putative ATP-grasp-modified RiPP [Streptosporangium amethystogenes]|uniref:putative ATP-grasp-modified RiPP n=1 Tax=Streptosporangium amethystogenes TaxID=2002 RepID=UPI0004C7D548|nr:putative ATP-grasp-modified RiPP [Streptosporangium amethystogenes]